MMHSENEKTVQLLVENGADVTATSASGLTALHRASFLSWFHIEMLLFIGLIGRISCGR